MGFAAKVWAIVRKDLAAELHTREIVSAMLVFAVLALLVFSFARPWPRRLASSGPPSPLRAHWALAVPWPASRAAAALTACC